MKEKIYLPFKIQEKDLGSFKSKETIFSIKILAHIIITYNFLFIFILSILILRLPYFMSGDASFPYKEITLLIMITIIKNIIIIYQCFGKLRYFRVHLFKKYGFIAMIIPLILDRFLFFQCIHLEKFIKQKLGINNLKESTIKKYEYLNYDKKDNLENCYSVKKWDTRVFLIIFFSDFILNTGFILTILDFFNNNYAYMILQ